MTQQRLKLHYIERYLHENTDEDHPVLISDIIHYLKGKGIPSERKAIYLDLEALSELGLDVQSRRQGRSTVYFIGNRDFQLPELKLLVDSVLSSKFITEKKSMELIKKLEGLASKHQASQLHHELHVSGRIKSMNESIYYNVDDISSAINMDSSITFKYFNWDARGKKVFKRSGHLPCKSLGAPMG